LGPRKPLAAVNQEKGRLRPFSSNEDPGASGAPTLDLKQAT
jgi:hypothetical protein